MTVDTTKPELTLDRVFGKSLPMNIEFKPSAKEETLDEIFGPSLFH